MGLFALLARFVPRWVRREERPHFAAAPMAPRRLERRRVFDAAAAGVMLEAIPDMQFFVQTGENLTATTQNVDQEPQVAALNGFPQATIRLREAELFEDQSTLAVISISDSSPLSHLVTIDWGDGSPLQMITAGDRQRDVLAVHKFLDDNPTATVSDTYTVKATVTNSLNESVTTSATILVKNVAPTINSLSINSPINENGTATLTGTYSDPGTLDTHQLDIDWDGNGSFDQTVTVSGGNFTVSLQILDDNPTGSSSDTFNVGVRLRDDDGGQATGSAQLTVRNVAPVLSNVAITSPIFENSSATLIGNYSDVGSRDTHQLDIDWDGNGTYEQTVTVAGGSFSISRQFLDDNPTGTTSDTFNVNIRLRDDDGGQATAAASLTVRNANPVLVLNPLATIDENGLAVLSGTYTDFGSQDTHQLDVDWNGDGVFDQTIAVTGGAFTVTRQFLDDNPTGTTSDTFNVNVRLRDDDGGTSAASQSLTVRNVAPVITRLTIETPINENGSTTLAGEYTDVGTQDTHQLDIDWDGNGTYDETITVTGGSFSVTHQFLDDNPTGSSSDTFNVGVRLRDDDGGQATQSVRLTVRNVAPVLSNVTITSPIVENGTATLSGNYTDVGSRDTHQLDIDWDGNGTYDQTVTVTGGSFSVSRQFLDDNPTGTTSDTFNVNIRLRDDDGGQATATTSLTVQNANPVLVLNPLATIDENGIATLSGTYTDVGSQDTHELDIDWDGDGTFDQTVAVVGGAFTVTRQFLDDNPTGTTSDTFNVNVRLRDDDGGSDTETTPLTVRNVNPVVTLIPPANINENELATLQGTISDVGSLDTFKLEINWGDPASSDNTQTFDLGTTALTEAVDGINWDPTTRTFSLTHQYLDDNPSGTAFDIYTIRATVTDDDLGSDVKETTARVNNLALTLDLQQPATINENKFATLQGTISDVGSLDTFKLEINWGDPASPDNTQTFDLGTTALTEAVDGINWDPATRTFSVTHQYLDDNPSGTAFDIYTIRATVTDDDLGSDVKETTVRVNNLALTLDLQQPATINENEFATLQGTISDVGSLDTFKLEINWGDTGSPTNTQSFELGETALTEEVDGINWDPTTRTFSLTHRYLDDNPSGTAFDIYTIRATVTDDDLGSDVKETTVRVNNVALSLNLEQPAAIDENGVAVLTGTISDVGSLDTFKLEINWGDSASPNNTQTFDLGLTPLTHAVDGIDWDPTTGIFTVRRQYLDDNPTATSSDSFAIAVKVTGDDLSSDSKITSVTVDNVAPQVVLDSMAAINENGTAVLQGHVTDPGSLDRFTIVIDWNDPLSPNNTQTFALGNTALTEAADGINWDPTTRTFSLSHQYLDDNPTSTGSDNYSVSVSVTDDDTGVGSDVESVEVRNVIPVVQLNPVAAINEGEEASVSGSFTDVGLLDTHRVFVTWSDGTVTEAKVVQSNGSGTFTATHTYVDNDIDSTIDPFRAPDNLYTIGVSVVDDDSGAGVSATDVFVKNINPTLDPLVATNVTSKGIATVTVTLFDPGRENQTIHIDWGDKLPDAIVVGPATSPTTYTFSHKYDGPPNPQNPAADITITVVIRDDDFGTNVVDDGESNFESIDITNPGIGGIPFRIDTTPQVPQLTFPVRTEVVVLPNSSGSNVVVQQDVRLGAGSGEAAATTDRFIELRVIDAEGNEGPGYRLRPEVLQDLPGLFRSLPDNHYVVYVVNMETNSRRLVIEVYVRNGKLIDPGDDSEGTRDRPPTDEQTTEPVDALPAEQTPATNEPAAALPQQQDVPTELSDVVPAAVTYRRISRWSALALGLAASSSSQSWAHRVDQAVAQATAQQWRKLQGHNPPKPKNQ